jgi:hypothetical protein
MFSSSALDGAKGDEQEERHQQRNGSDDKSQDEESEVNHLVKSLPRLRSLRAFARLPARFVGNFGFAGSISFAIASVIQI